jgi:trehalose 6-phosphate phosphatase
MRDIESLGLDNRSSLFLDFDGTLAEFKVDPQDVYLNKQTLNSILSLRASLDGRLAIVSGRDIEDLELRIPQCVYRVGNHGAYTA